MADINDIFRQFATAFSGAIKDAKPICFPEKLHREKLDLSLDSLKHVDTYLTYLHAHKNGLGEDEWHSTVLYGGAHVGEVIRNETNNYYHWLDYDDYIPTYPELKIQAMFENYSQRRIEAKVIMARSFSNEIQY